MNVKYCVVGKKIEGVVATTRTSEFFLTIILKSLSIIPKDGGIKKRIVPTIGSQKREIRINDADPIKAEKKSILGAMNP